jgi:hypothetical protein
MKAAGTTEITQEGSQSSAGPGDSSSGEVLCLLCDERIKIGNCYLANRLAPLPQQRQKNPDIFSITSKCPLCDATMATTEFAVFL